MNEFQVNKNLKSLKCLEKIIKHKMFDKEEVKVTWHQFIVTKVLDDNETSDDCDFTMKHKSFDECVIILGTLMNLVEKNEDYSVSIFHDKTKVK